MGKAANLAVIGSIADTSLGFRNRILNGGMVIDQRNAGASVTASTTGSPVYTLDRWAYFVNQASKFTVQRSTTAPSGFTNSLLITSSSAYSVGSGDFLLLRGSIEGFNIADLGWGAAGAQSVTLSFVVRSSLTGQFGGALRNGAGNYSYPFSYTINAANTWETKTITIAGPTAGTWLTDNSLGIEIDFSMGAGSTYTGTAGSWSAATLVNSTGSTSVVGTNGATFYITGVQLEAGSVASPFERRDYGRELAMCQRYTFKTEATTPYTGAIAVSSPSTNAAIFIQFPVTMRAAPTFTASGNLTVDDQYATTTTGTGTSASTITTSGARILISGITSLTAPRPMQIAPSNTATMTFSIEL